MDKSVFRIVPLVFVVLLFVIAFAAKPLDREFFLYDFTFTTNIYASLTRADMYASFHLWSVDVEMQYYLAYPFLSGYVDEIFY